MLTLIEIERKTDKKLALQMGYNLLELSNRTLAYKQVQEKKNFLNKLKCLFIF